MRRTIIARLIAGLIALALVAGTGGQMNAFAQSNSCSKLSRTLRTLERNSDYRNLASNSEKARELGGAISKAESNFVRAGCQKLLNAGKKLTRECRTAARQITRARSSLGKLNRRVETGRAIAQQREAVLQNIARFSCGTSASSARSTQTSGERKTFLEQLFDTLSGRNRGESEAIIGDDFTGYAGRATYRSVCVRKSDGYYWPVSFSTVSSYLQNDAGQCATQCPGAEVELYYYRNPGEEPEDMVSLAGDAYSSLPNAFLYRREFDRSNMCQQEVNFGTIELAGDEGTSRAMVAFAEISFPLPLRDPRRTVQTQVAQIIHIPLPRPRPGKEGEGIATTPPAISTAELTTIQSAGKSVRIVGPHTPYVQAAAAGS